jgi:FixJ family two-component response regulator
LQPNPRLNADVAAAAEPYVTNASPVILVVDDDDSVRKALGRLIASAGFDVESFAVGEDMIGRGRFAECACAVLDVRLSGMSGPEIQERLRTIAPALRIIFITAHYEESLGAAALAAGAIAYLRKPFDEHELLSAVRTAVSQWQQPQS